jgi:hypothetical protein
VSPAAPSWLRSAQVTARILTCQQTLGCSGLLAPDAQKSLAVANRNFLIHQYDEFNRELTWLTLLRDLPEWKPSLATLFDAADATISEEPERD